MSTALSKEQEIEAAWAEHRAFIETPYRLVLSLVLRERLAEAQNWRCCYCGIRMEGTATDWDAPTFEHVVPRSKGGPDAIDNLVIACRRCNEGRGNGGAQ